MKDLMDFCIGTVVFSLLGYSLMMGQDTFLGLIGTPDFSLFCDFGSFIASPADGSFTGASTFVFNLVFCATTFLKTTIAPSVATCVTMIFTWVRNGKPDVSMCLNASLAGLVGVTAGCDAVDALGAAAIGAVSGILVVVIVELLDLKLHIDDPVGAVGVHLANGFWGTLAVGLFANPAAPAGLSGLFYGGGFTQLGIQALGVVSVSFYAVVMMVITFSLIRRLHGLPSACPDFTPAVDTYSSFNSEKGSLYRPYRRRKDFCVRCGKCCEDPHRRGRV